MVGGYHLTVAGIVSDEGFHKCLQCIKELQAKGIVSSTVYQFF